MGLLQKIILLSLNFSLFFILAFAPEINDFLALNPFNFVFTFTVLSLTQLHRLLYVFLDHLPYYYYSLFCFFETFVSYFQHFLVYIQIIFFVFYKKIKVDLTLSCLFSLKVSFSPTVMYFILFY